MRRCHHNVSLSLVASLATSLISGVASAASDDTNLLHFRGYQLSAYQKNGNLFSGGGSWSPSVGISKSFSLGIDAGAYVLKMDSQDYSAALEIGARATFGGSDFKFEIGGGLQRWFYNSLNAPFATVGISIPTKSFISEYFAAYSVVMIPKTLTHELKIGVGLF